MTAPTGGGGDRSLAKRAATRRGRRGERLAAWYLRLKGYRILAVNQRLPGGEIDLVARRGRVLAFVEIKTREIDAGDAAGEIVAPRQWRRIAAAAAQFAARRADCAGLDWRYDALVLARGRWPRHLADAWRPEP
jgi:putative endonuclease